MKKNELPATGFFSLVLHAHQPYVLHHGTWPHGLEWLLEAAAETYLPFLRTVRRLHEEGITVCVHLSLSPVLLQQLIHPVFKSELPAYLRRKITAAREDESFFELAGEQHLRNLAHQWAERFQIALEELKFYNGDLVEGFRRAQSQGVLLLTSAATHGYIPLLGTDASAKAQFRTAVEVHEQQLGSRPRGVWLPECGYRPAGNWHFPVQPDGLNQPQDEMRAGTESILAESGLEYTFVDAPLVEDAQTVPVTNPPVKLSAYLPYMIAGSNVAVFPRDPRTAFQVWSPQFGYPGDFHYLDFHKKRWPGGHRYWRVTGTELGMEAKQPYYPDAAAESARGHAEHLVALIAETLRNQKRSNRTAQHPPILTAPFDMELFGHWWHEGLQFLEHLFRLLHAETNGVRAIACDEYLKTYGIAANIRMHEGSWGTNGDHSVWLNSETSQLLSTVYAAELFVRDSAKLKQWTDGKTGERIARQLCRELLLMEASDWPSLITTGAARDYAEDRFRGHAEAFQLLRSIWNEWLATATLSEQQQQQLEELETLDGVFSRLHSADWKS